MPHSSVEAGERPSRTPWSEGGAASWTGSWNHAEDIDASSACHTNETTESCEGQRFHNVTNRMPFNVHVRIRGRCDTKLRMDLL